MGGGILSNFSRWPDKLPFRNPDGSWVLEWFRWFSRIDSSVNTANAIPTDPFSGASPGRGAEDGSSTDLSLSAIGMSQSAAPPDGAALSIQLRQASQVPQWHGFPPPHGVAREDPSLSLMSTLGPQRQVLPVAIRDTHAARANYPPGSFPVGALYGESDRQAIYQNTGSAWVYLTGRMTAAWASLPADLVSNDTGFEFFDNVNSQHVWEWTGSAWDWGAGDRHSGEFGQFDADPGTGWHLCNGAINQTKYAADGTRVTNFTVPDQREFYLEASATYTGTGVAAVRPTISGITEDSPVAISGVTDVDGGTGTPLLYTAGAVSVTVAAHTHTHAKGSLAGDNHHHALTSANAPISDTGRPPTFAVLPYYRL